MKYMDQRRRGTMPILTFSEAALHLLASVSRMDRFRSLYIRYLGKSDSTKSDKSRDYLTDITTGTSCSNP